VNTNNLQEDYILPILSAVTELELFSTITDRPFEDANKEDYPAFILDEVTDQVISTSECTGLNIIQRRGRFYILETLSPEARLPFDSFKIDVDQSDEGLEMDKLNESIYEMSEIAEARRKVDELVRAVVSAISGAVNYVITLESRIFRNFQIGEREVFACELNFINKFAESI